MQPLSARCMRVMLHFRMGANSLPVVQVRCIGAPRTQRLCQLGDQRAVGGERHIVFECPALQGVGEKYAAFNVEGACTMQQWKQDLIGVADVVKTCLDMLDAPVCAGQDLSIHPSKPLAAGTDVLFLLSFLSASKRPGLPRGQCARCS